MNNESVRLVLIRHGEVAANRGFCYLGRRDDVLTARGREQAAALSKTLAGLRIDAVLSSPLRRTLETAEIVAARVGHVVEVDDRLVELDFGDWDGRSRAEVVAIDDENRRTVEAWEADPTLPAPGGESLADVERRAVELARDLAATRAGSTVALVTHMGVIKTLLLSALGMPLSSAARIFLDPATISVIDWCGGPVVRLVNSHAHLGFANARWMSSP